MAALCIAQQASSSAAAAGAGRGRPRAALGPVSHRPLLAAAASPALARGGRQAAPSSPMFAGGQAARRGAGPARRVRCRGLFGLGLPELAVIAGVAALIFGPSKLPEIGKSMGKTVKSFQSAAKEFETELKAASADDADPAAAPPADQDAAAKKE